MILLNLATFFFALCLILWARRRLAALAQHPDRTLEHGADKERVGASNIGHHGGVI